MLLAMKTAGKKQNRQAQVYYYLKIKNSALFLRGGNQKMKKKFSWPTTYFFKLAQLSQQCECMSITWTQAKMLSVAELLTAQVMAQSPLT